MIIKCYQIPSADSSSSGATLWSEAESNNTKQLTSFTVHVLYLFIYLFTKSHGGKQSVCWHVVEKQSVNIKVILCAEAQAGMSSASSALGYPSTSMVIRNSAETQVIRLWHVTAQWRDPTLTWAVPSDGSFKNNTVTNSSPIHSAARMQRSCTSSPPPPLCESLGALALIRLCR